MDRTHLFLMAQAFTFWPVWQWYGLRMIDGSDEPWGLLALITACGVIVLQGQWRAPVPGKLVPACAWLGLYAVCYPLAAPLLRAVLAVIALAFGMSALRFGKRLQPGLLGLLLLSLPVIASLQFYAGYPVRLLTAYCAAWVIGGFGLEVDAQGTLLLWLGEVVAVDAPCAGIKMLWTGLYLHFTLAAWRHLGLLATWLSTSFTLFAVFLGNVARASLLFFTESGIVDAPGFAHQAIGIVVFAGVATAIVCLHRRLTRGRAQCVG